MRFAWAGPFLALVVLLFAAPRARSLPAVADCAPCGQNGGAAALDVQPAQTGEWPEVRLERVFQGFNDPVYLTHAGDGSERLFIVEQRGRVLAIRDGKVQDQPFLDIRNRVSCCGERGLLGIAFPPDFAAKGHFYVNYTDLSGDTVIARYPLSANRETADPDGEEIILTVDQPFANHNGGQLAFGRDGYLYIGMGDGGSAGDPMNFAQNPGSLLGKLLRIDVESGSRPYRVPSDNPFVRRTGYRPEIWALGLRNPWRFSFDRNTGDLYLGDVGQGSQEEIDFQPASSTGGENYGWKIMEGSRCFASPACDLGGLTLPVAEYTHAQGCSVTGGMVYRGAASPTLRGVYFYGDFCSGRIWGLRREGASWRNRVLLETDLSIVSFGEDEAGEVYVVDHNGDLFRLRSDAPVSEGANLTGAWVRLVQNCRGSTSNPRCSISGQVEVRNRGGAAAGASRLAIYLSADPVLDPADRLLQRISVSKLSAGRTQRKTVAANLPTGRRASGGFILAVVDADGKVAEGDEADNRAAFGPVP